ncbi:hypothetical protein HGP37_001898, partial [Campylobacter jejuni]|nr:hypothetical protein [Campylobacter jejuni]
IKDNEKEIKAGIKAITEFATSFKDLAIGAGLAYVAFKSFNSFKNSSFFTSLSNGIKNVKKDYDDLIIKQKEMKELVINQRNLKFQAQSFKDAIKDLERLQSLMPQKAKEVSNLAPFYSTSQKTMISAEKMLLQQEALKNIRNLEEEIKKNETLIN